MELKEKYSFMANAKVSYDDSVESAIEGFCMEVEATLRARPSNVKVNSIIDVDGRIEFDVTGDKIIQSIVRRYYEMINGPLALGELAIAQRQDENESEE